MEVTHLVRCVFSSAWGRTAWLMLPVAIWYGAGDIRPAAAECSPTHQQEADLAYGTAAEFLAAGKVLTAIPGLESALNICPEHVTTLMALGKAYRDAGDLLKSRADSLATANAGGAAKMTMDRAQLLYEKSKSTYAKFLALRGDAAEAADYAGQALTLVRLKDYAGARASFIKARALTPDDCNVLTNLAVMHAAVQDYRSSVATYEEALQNCPDQADKIYPRLADACKKGAEKETKIGNNADAQIYSAKYQQYASEGGGSTAFSLAVSKMKNLQYGEAITLFQQILQETPGKLPARLNLGRCLVAQGQHGAAVAEYEQYLAVDPDNEKAHAELIGALVELKRCTEAQTRAQQAVARFQAKGATHLGWIYYHYGVALECTGDYAGAIDKFRQSLQSGDSELAQRAGRQIDRQEQFIAREKKKAQQGG